MLSYQTTGLNSHQSDDKTGEPNKQTNTQDIEKAPIRPVHMDILGNVGKSEHQIKYISKESTFSVHEKM
jgi:hypothetical protein